MRPTELRIAGSFGYEAAYREHTVKKLKNQRLERHRLVMEWPEGKRRFSYLFQSAFDAPHSIKTQYIAADIVNNFTCLIFGNIWQQWINCIAINWNISSKNPKWYKQ